MNLLVSLLLATLLAPQTAAPQRPAAPVRPPAEPSAGAPPAVTAGQGVYTIGPQDLLTVTVFDEPELTNRYRVDNEGMVTFPLIGRVPAGGLKVSEFEDRLRQQLAAGYLKNPQVRVEIDQVQEPERLRRR